MACNICQFDDAFSPFFFSGSRLHFCTFRKLNFSLFSLKFLLILSPSVMTPCDVALEQKFYIGRGNFFSYQMILDRRGKSFSSLLPHCCDDVIKLWPMSFIMIDCVITDTFWERIYFELNNDGVWWTLWLCGAYCNLELTLNYQLEEEKNKEIISRHWWDMFFKLFS